MPEAVNGSTTAVEGSGINAMSDSLIAFQPAIDDPSKYIPFEYAFLSSVSGC